MATKALQLGGMIHAASCRIQEAGGRNTQRAKRNIQTA